MFHCINKPLTFRIFDQPALALKTEFALKFLTVLKYLYHSGFLATCPCPENRVCPEDFQAVGTGRQTPRLVRLCTQLLSK